MKTRQSSLSKQLSEMVSAPSEIKKPALSITIPINEKSPLELKIEKVKKNILGIRATSEQLLINEHKIDNLKTAVLIDKDKFLPDTRFHQSEMLEKALSHRPVAKISQKSRVNSPVAVMTPTGTILPRVARFGVLSLFSNDASAIPIIDLDPITSLIDKEKFYSSESFDSIVEPDKNEKEKHTIVTHKMLEKRRAEDLKNAFRRSVSQNKIMAKDGVPERKGSATDYVYETSLFENDIRWEWLHLVAHMMMGAPSQTSDNLVAGTAFSNTEMMFAEASLNYLARVYPEGFKISVKATLIPETHIAIAIQYLIITPDFTIPLEFNTQTRNKPHVDYQRYFDYLVEQLVFNAKCSLGKFKKEKSDDIISYSKKDIAKDNIPIVSNKKPQELKVSNSQHDRPKRKVVIDTETTGLLVSDGDRVVEIGAVEILNGKFTGKEYRQVINPERSIPKLLHYKGIHHITDAVVKDKPIFKDVADKFCEFIKDAELIGHNLPFDMTMLENEFKLANRTDTFVGRYATDTLAEARKLLPKNKNPELPSHKLDDLCEYYRIDVSSRENGHDALVDSRLAGQLYLHLADAENEQKITKNKLAPTLFSALSSQKQVGVSVKEDDKSKYKAK